MCDLWKLKFLLQPYCFVLYNKRIMPIMSSGISMEEKKHFNHTFLDGANRQKKTKIEEARELIASSVLTHVTATAFNFKVKVINLTIFKGHLTVKPKSS